MGPTTSSSQTSKNDNSKRKRHKSAGDHSYVKTRSNSLFSSWRHNSQGSEEKPVKYSELVTKDQQANLIETAGERVEKEFLKSEMQDISEEIKDSGVGLDENEVGGEEEELAERFGAVGIVTNDEESSNNDKGTKCDDVNSCDSSGKKLDSIREIKSRSGSLKSSATSSPVHYVATPVTENDPLGLFMDTGETPSASNSRESSVSKSSPEKVREQFVSKKPFEDELSKQQSDLGRCNSVGSSSNEDSNRVDSSGRALSPINERQKLNLERTSSFPENLGNSSKGGETPRKSDFINSEVASLGRSSSSLHEAKVEGNGLFRTGSFRRHKNNLSGMLKFATGAVANKLSELKVSITPSKLGSNMSLTPSCEDLDSEDEVSRESTRKKGSLDFLHRSIDRLDTFSINGLHGNSFNTQYFMPSSHLAWNVHVSANIFQLMQPVQRQEILYKFMGSFSLTEGLKI